jgi:hypothetical protein
MRRFLTRSKVRANRSSRGLELFDLFAGKGAENLGVERNLSLIH